MAYVQKLTDSGRDVIAKGQTGLRITFTRVQLGRGEPPLEQIPDMTALVSPVMNCAIVSVARTQIGQWTITAKVPLSTIGSDFYLGEIGVWAEAGNEPEVLYGVSIVAPGGVPAIISPEMGGGSTAEHTIAVAVTVGTTEEVTAVFDPDIELVNIGAPSVGPGVYKDRIGVQFRLRRLVAGEGMAIGEEADLVRFSSIAVPSGAMVPFAGRFAPQGWLLCNGAEYPKEEFPALAALLGNTYGGGETTFAVPDCRDRTLVGTSLTKALGTTGGSETHALTVAQLALHNHQITDNGHDHGSFVLDSGHSHAVIDAVHGHSSPAHTHSVSMGGGNAPEGMAWGAGITYSPGGTGQKGLMWIPRTYGLGNSPDSTRVEYNPWLAWAQNAAASAAATAVAVNNAWSNISATHAQFTGVRIPNGRTNIQVQNAGNGQAFSLMQPYVTVNYIIRT